MATDYIPADDAGLLAYAQNFQAKLTANEEDFGIVLGEGADFGVHVTQFLNALTAANTAKSAAQVTNQTKNTERTELIQQIRMKARQLQAHPDFSDAKRTDFGLTVRDTTPTAVPAPVSAPILWIDTKDRLRHTINFYDENTPNSKAKPAGVFGMEIHRKIGGDAPVSIAECQFIGLDTATPYVIDYDAPQGGVMVHYMARWATRSGLTGPSSVVYSATVVA